MSELNETESSSRRNPLIWISLAVIGLILFVFLNGKRGDSIAIVSEESVTPEEIQPQEEEAVGTIERSLLVPPGMRARQYIAQLRSEGKPYPLELVYEKALGYLQEGSLADSHLLFFFAAREGFMPAMMTMGEMSDPTQFRAENSLLDNADVIQAYKWYQQAAELGHQPARDRVAGLHQWALEEVEEGNFHARQLLLNFE